MKALLHRILLPLLLLVFLLPGTALADDFGGYYGEDSPTFTMYKASSVIRPGQESTITLSFNNITNYSAYYGYAVLTVSEDNTKIFGEDGGNYMSREIGSMSRLDVTTVDYVFTPSADLKSGTYDMTATLVFKNRQGSVFTKDYPVKITVDSGTPVDLQITESSVTGGQAVYGQPFDLNVTLLNNGETTARDVRISLNNLSEDKIFQSGSYYSPSFADIKKYSAEHLTFNLIASDNIADGYHPVELKINYNENGEAQEKILKVYVDVKGSPDSDEDEDGNKLSTPRVILGDCTLPATVNMGEPFRFDFKLKNTSTDRTVKNLQVSLTSAEGTVMPAKGTNSFYVAEIAPGGTASLGLDLTTKYDTEKTSYPLTLEIHYEDAKANAYTATENLTIPVFLPTKLTFQNENYPEFGMVGQSSYLSLEYINQGKGTIYNLTASVEGDVQTDIGSGTYIGNINSGNQDSLEVMVTPLTAGTTECKLVFTYEDAAGNQLRTEKPFMLTAEEMPEPDPGMMDPGMDMPMEEEPSGLPGWLLPVGGVLVLAAAATAFNIKRKKAKAAKLAEEEALFAEGSDLDD